MASFTAGTTFVDGVSNDVTAAKLGALVTNATPTSGFIQDRTAETVVGTNDTILIGDASDSNNLKRMTVANILKAPLVSTSGTIDNLTTGTTTSTAQIVTSGTTATFNSTTGTIATLNSTTGTIANLVATTSTFLGTITGSTNVVNIGSGQIYKDASGNVGIGTTSPADKLDVYGVAYFRGIEVGKSGLSGNRNAGIDFTGDDTYTDFGLRIIRDNVGVNANNTIQTRGTGQLALFTQEAGPIVMSTTSTERLRIDSSGNVGIGTTSPAFALNVKAPASEYRTALFETLSSSGPSVQIKGSKTYELRSTGTGATEGGGLFFIYDKDNEASRITVGSTGNVGIGTVSPAAKFDADGCIRSIGQNVPSSGAGAEIVYASNIAAFYGYDRTNGTFTNTVIDGLNVTIRSNGVDRATINSSGNCSIGTATALSKLHVHGDLTMSNATTAVTAATGGVSKPATYAGFLTVSINGTSRKIPYYA